MSEHEDDPPLIPPAPRVPEEVPTGPGFPVPDSDLPPPAGAEYFDRAYRQLLRVHQEQMKRYAELLDQDGPLSQLFRQIDLVLHDIRQLRVDWEGMARRVGMTEQRLDAHDRRIRNLEAANRGLPTEPAPPPAP